MTAPGTGLGVMQLGDQVVGDRQEEIDGWWADSVSDKELSRLCRLHGGDSALMEAEVRAAAVSRAKHF